MAFDYCDMTESQFERLVVQAGKLLLGKAVQGFKSGRDGGRDARFEGVANAFPSAADPWSGITIIQAKHTEKLGYFSDPAFSGSTDFSVLTEELKRVTRLRSRGELDNYILYSNRHVTGAIVDPIKKRITREAGIPGAQIHLCGIDDLEDAMAQEPRLLELARYNPMATPMRFSSRELAEVVEALASSLNTPDTPIGNGKLTRTRLVDKNRLNGVRKAYTDRLWRTYAEMIPQIQNFLEDPQNRAIRELYKESAIEFDLKIIANRDTVTSFEKAVEYLTDQLSSQNPALSRKKRLTRAMVFYMYWDCDIGIVEDVEDEDEVDDDLTHQA